jgi:beta-hydroxylase
MFHPLRDFPFAAALERSWSRIREECLGLEQDEFAAWHERGLYRGRWDVYGLYLEGRPILENCVFCPVSAALLRDVPGLTMAGFSRLAPDTRIAPHVGYTDKVLRLHLGLSVPEGCGLRVGGETRAWQEGRCLVFDDTVEHEAWNYGGGDRLVLLVDFLRSSKTNNCIL